MDVYIAKIAFIGATIVTVGDAIAAWATGLALQQLQNPTDPGSRSQNRQSNHSETIENQIDDFISELRQIKKMMR